MIRYIWILLALTNCSTEEATDGTNTGQASCDATVWMLSVKQVLDWKDDQGVVLFDIGKPDEYAGEHIEGAQHIWRTDYTASSEHEVAGMMADSSTIRKMMQSKGVNLQDRIVVYDRRGGVEAMRLKWILEMYGAPEIYLMNGGLHAWKAAGLPTSSGGVEGDETGNFQFPADPPIGRLIQKEDIEQNLANEAYLFLDARSLPEYHGVTQKPGAIRPGRIPGAIHLDWMEMIQPEEGYRFLRCEEIQPKLEERGITAEHKIITYCHSGVRSAHLAYVLTDIMGFEQVWNYDGSWIEWSHDLSLPVEISQPDTMSLSLVALVPLLPLERKKYGEILEYFC